MAHFSEEEVRRKKLLTNQAAHWENAIGWTIYRLDSELAREQIVTSSTRSLLAQILQAARSSILREKKSKIVEANLATRISQLNYQLKWSQKRTPQGLEKTKEEFLQPIKTYVEDLIQFSRDNPTTSSQKFPSLYEIQGELRLFIMETLDLKLANPPKLQSLIRRFTLQLVTTFQPEDWQRQIDNFKTQIQKVVSPTQLETVYNQMKIQIRDQMGDQIVENLRLYIDRSPSTTIQPITFNKESSSISGVQSKPTLKVHPFIVKKVHSPPPPPPPLRDIPVRNIIPLRDIPLRDIPPREVHRQSAIVNALTFLFCVIFAL